MRNKKTLALTLGLGLAVGSLTMGTATIGQANQRPAGMQNMQMGHQRTIYDQVNHNEMLALLKIDEQTYKEEADSGKSLAQIGAAHHASRQAILDLVVRHMNHQIDKGLRDNRITAAQAIEMKTNAVVTAQKMIDRQPMGSVGAMGPIGFDKMHNRPVSPEMLTLLQIDEQTFREEQNSGNTLAQIAITHNVSRQAMVDLVVKEMSHHIDQGVADKLITAAQATEMKINIVDRAEKMVDGQFMGPMGFDNMHNRPVSPEMLTLLQIDEQTFRQEQSNGNTLAQIAASHNVSRQAVVDLVVKNMIQQIDQRVADNRMTAAQATEMKTNAEDQAQKMVDKNMMEHPVHPQK